MKTGGKMQTVDSDCRLLKCLVLPFPLSRANRQQATLSVIQVNRSVKEIKRYVLKKSAVLPMVCFLRFTLSLHFTTGLQ